MKVHVIVVNGTGGVGKDTFVGQATIYIGSNGPKDQKAMVRRLTTINKVMDAAKILGWVGQKDAASRKFLSDLKDLYTGYCDGPFMDIEKEILNDVQKYTNHYNHLYYFVMCREPEEIQKFVDRWDNQLITGGPCIYGEIDVTTILITREGYITDGNHADEMVYDYVYDYYIENPLNDLTEYKRGIDVVMDELFIKWGVPYEPVSFDKGGFPIVGSETRNPGTLEVQEDRS